MSGLPISVHEAAWRKRASVKATELKRLHAELNLRIMHIRRYLEAVEESPKGRAWKLRAKIGERKRWYHLPEESQ